MAQHKLTTSFPPAWAAPACLAIMTTWGCTAASEDTSRAKRLEQQASVCSPDLAKQIAYEFNQGYQDRKVSSTLETGFPNQLDLGPWGLDASVRDRLLQHIDPAGAFGGDSPKSTKVSYQKETLPVGAYTVYSLPIQVRIEMGPAGSHSSRVLEVDLALEIPPQMDLKRTGENFFAAKGQPKIRAYATDSTGKVNGLWHCEDGAFITNHELTKTTLGTDSEWMEGDGWTIRPPGDAKSLVGIEKLFEQKEWQDKYIAHLFLDPSSNPVPGNVLTALEEIENVEIHIVHLGGRPIEGPLSLDGPVSLDFLFLGDNPEHEVTLAAPCAAQLRGIDVSGVIVDDYTPLLQCNGLEELLAGPVVNAAWGIGLDPIEAARLANDARRKGRTLRVAFTSKEGVQPRPHEIHPHRNQ